MARKKKTNYVPDPARQKARKIARLRKALRAVPYDRCAYEALRALGVTDVTLAPTPSEVRRQKGVTLTAQKAAFR